LQENYIATGVSSEHLNNSTAFEIAAFLVFIAELAQDAFLFQTSTLCHSISQFWSALLVTLD